MVLFHSFLWLSNIPLCISDVHIYMYSIRCDIYIYIYILIHIFIHLLVNEHLSCFHVLALVNSVAVSTTGHVSFQSTVFSGYKPKSQIVGSCDGSTLSFLANLHTALDCGCTKVWRGQAILLCCCTLCKRVYKVIMSVHILLVM